MKAYEGFKAQRRAAKETIPAGGYIGEILDAAEKEYNWGSVLVISFDVREGEYQDFFKIDYQNNTSEDRKWRGTYRLNVPKDDGSEKDGWTKNTFESAIWAIEESNPGYHWDWNEKGLKKKKVGLLFRNREWVMNGNTGWTTECGALESVDAIRSGKFKPLKDKPLPEDKRPVPAFTPDIEVDGTDDLPWD